MGAYYKICIIWETLF